MHLLKNAAWKSFEHSDEENIRWAWLRAVEWGSYPVFLSQPIIPLLLISFSWRLVIITLIVIHIIWIFMFRYAPCSKLYLLSWGAYFVRLKWMSCLISASYLYFSDHQYYTAALALAWPIIAMLLGNIPSPLIGKIQEMLLEHMGYMKIGGEFFRNTSYEVAENVRHKMLTIWSQSRQVLQDPDSTQEQRDEAKKAYDLSSTALQLQDAQKRKNSE